MSATAVAPAAARDSLARAARLGRNRDFRLLWIGQMASELGSSVSAVAMPLLALAITGSPVLAGALATISFAAMTLSAMPAGYVADRYDGRRIMVICDAVRLGALALVALSVALGFASIWLLFAVGAICSVADMVFGPAVARALRAIVARDDVPEAVAATEARSYGADLVGPSAGGLLFAAGRVVPFVFDAITFAVSLVCTMRLRTRLAPEEPDGGTLRFLPGVAAGWRHVRRDAFLLSSTAYSTVMNVAVSTLMFVLILGTGDSADGAVVVGAALSLAAGAGMLGSIVAPVVQRRFGLRPVLVGVALARTAVVLAAALTGSAIAIALALASVVLLSPLVGAVMATARMLLVPEDIFGRVTGTTSFISSVLQPAAPLLAGLLIAALTQQAGLLVIAAAFAAVTLLAVLIPGLDALEGKTAEEH
jgi:MFS family permease